MPDSPPKKRVYLLCGHEPTLDPRIDWEANYAADQYDVKVIGFGIAGRPKPAVESNGRYQLVRAPRLEVFTSIKLAVLAKHYYFGRHKKLFWLCAMVALPIAVPLLAVVWLLLFAVELVFRILGLLLWPLRRFVTTRALRLVIRTIGHRVYHRLRLDRMSSVGWLVRYFASTNYDLVMHVLSEPPPDVVHCNDLDTLLAGVICRKLIGCRVVYDAHEYWPHSDPNAAFWEVRLFSRYERRLAPQADAAFTVSPHLAVQMGKAYRTVFESVPNTAPVEDGEAVAFSSTLGDEANGRVKFLFQGNFAPGRGIEEFLSAWAQADTTNGVLFLRGPESEARNLCIEHAKRLGVLGTSVHFMKAVSEDELIAAAQEADVGVIPYKPIWEGYRYACPNKLSQYMQAGLVILANNLDYVKQIMDRYSCGLAYDYLQPATAVAAIERLIQDGELRRAMSANAKRWAREEFNWQVQSKPLYEAYSALTNNRRHVVTQKAS